MIVWIAEDVTDYEGSNILGVFSTEPKAMQACKDSFANFKKEWEDKSDRELVWRNGSAVGLHSDQHYEVSCFEVDKD